VSNNKSVCDEANFKMLYEKYAKDVRNFMYYKCGDLAKAEDFMQQTFFKLWTNCKKVIFEKTKSYLFTVANNDFLKDVAHQKVKLKFQQESTHTDHSAKKHDQADDLIRQKELKEHLEDVISKLTESQREVFLLNRIDKLKYREIADMLNISVKAVEKRMQKALESVNEGMREFGIRKI